MKQCTTCELIQPDREAVEWPDAAQAGRNAPTELVLAQVHVQQAFCIAQRCRKLTRKFVCAEINTLETAVRGNGVPQGSTEVVLVCSGNKATSLPSKDKDQAFTKQI